jgi:hypothetical protein
MQHTTPCPDCDGYSYCFCRTCLRCGAHFLAKSRDDLNTRCRICLDIGDDIDPESEEAAEVGVE